MVLELILIRHGETIANSKKINQGQKGGRLTKTGILQAKKAGLFLKDFNINEIYISDLYRTKQTSNQIIKYHKNSKIIYTDKLREVNLGNFEETPYGSVSKYCKENNLDRFNFKPKNGESLFDVKKRVMGFTNKILKKERKIIIDEKNKKTILFVTHGGPIIDIIMGLLNISSKKYKKYIHDNTGITKFRITKNKTKIIFLNKTKHLENDKYQKTEY